MLYTRLCRIISDVSEIRRKAKMKTFDQIKKLIL